MGRSRWTWTLLGYLLLWLAGEPAQAAVPGAQDSAPSLDGTAASTSSISWTWGDAVGESYYEIHDADTEAVVGRLPSNSTAFLEEGLSENTRYRRHLHASFGGRLSPPSNALGIYTLVHEPTTGDFSLSLSGNDAINVQVVPPPHAGEDLTGVEITRNGAGIRSPFAPVYVHLDGGLQPDTEYSYFIRFRNGDGRATGFSYPLSLRTPPGEIIPNCRVRLDIPQSSTWLPEGDPYGDELHPGNKITAYVSWETDTLGHGPSKRTLTVVLFPSRVPGQCSNSGELSLEDFTIEASDNAGLWDLVGVDLDYSGDQRLSARTKLPVPPFTPIPIILTSYDWGGTVTVHAEAESCTSQEKDVPDDEDKDTLPDFFEVASHFWVRNGAAWVRTPFNKGSQFSAGPGRVRDDLNDFDMDDRPAPLHAVPGDGLTAYEEYRGVKVQGEVGRTRDLVDERARKRSGGTDVKDLFVLDEKADGGRQHLFFVNSKYLADSGLIWHTVLQGDVYHQGKFVPMNIHFSKTQYAIRMKGGSGFEIDGRKPVAISDLSVKSQDFILVDLKRIKASATSLKISLEDLLDWVVSHEIHHKLGMRHNRGQRSYVVNPFPDPGNGAEADRKSWWISKENTVELHIAVYKEKGAAHPLEYVDNVPNLDPKARDLQIKSQSFMRTFPKGQVTIHGDVHDAGAHRAGMLDVLQQVQLKEQKVNLATHERNLMDPVIHPRETDGVKNDPLPPVREREPNVRS